MKYEKDKLWILEHTGYLRYLAKWYVSDVHQWQHILFDGYSKKEVIRQLRHDYNITVPKEALI